MPSPCRVLDWRAHGTASQVGSSHLLSGAGVPGQVAFVRDRCQELHHDRPDTGW